MRRIRLIGGCSRGQGHKSAVPAFDYGKSVKRRVRKILAVVAEENLLFAEHGNLAGVSGQATASAASGADYC
jgi:hypothetical protein